MTHDTFQLPGVCHATQQLIYRRRPSRQRYHHSQPTSPDLLTSCSTCNPKVVPGRALTPLPCRTEICLGMAANCREGKGREQKGKSTRRVGKRWNGLPRQVAEPPPQEMLKAQLEQPWASCCSQPSLRACSPRLPFCWNRGAATLCHLLHRRLAQNEAPLAVLRREHGPCCRQCCKYRTKKQVGVQCGQSPCCHLEIASFFN